MKVILNVNKIKDIKLYFFHCFIKNRCVDRTYRMIRNIYSLLLNYFVRVEHFKLIKTSWNMFISKIILTIMLICNRIPRYVKRWASVYILKKYRTKLHTYVQKECVNILDRIVFIFYLPLTLQYLILELILYTYYF